MRTRICILAVVILFLTAAFATAADTAVPWEEQHSDESYLYLLMERTVEVRKDWTKQETVHHVVRIQKEDAKVLGEIPIDYDKSFQEVKDIKAYVTTPDGKRIKYKSIQDLRPYSGQPFYSDSAIKIITMPNVVPGTIIDWEATIVTKKPIIKNSFWDYFYFTCGVPVESIRYQLIIPKGMPAQIMNRNIDIKPATEEKAGKIIYAWGFKFLDKMEPEEYMPPSDEFDRYVIVSNIKDWVSMADWYAGLVNKNLKTSAEMKDKVHELIKDKEKVEDKIQAIIEFIQDNFRYVSMSFGYNNYEPHPSDEVFNNKYGDCKDQVLVAIAMLKEADITAYPALYCDEDSGNPAHKLPAPVYFDHVILGIEVEGRIHYTDILLKGHRFNEPCSALEGGYVFLVKPLLGQSADYIRQLPILSEQDDATSTEARIAIRDDGSALVEISSLWSKDFSIDMREQWKSMTEKQKQEFLESLDETHTAGGRMLERRWDNIDNRYERIKSFIKYEKPCWAEVSGDFMTFGFGRYDRESDFAVKTRKYPIMFWSNSLHQSTNTYIIPKGFEILNIPKDIKLTTEFVDFIRIYKTDGRVITETEITRYKRVRLPPSDYEKIKDFYNKLSQLTNEKIIIKRRE